MDIPSVLETQIREGKTVLFLGAGASLAAKDATGQSPPSAYKLGEAISERFLGGQFKELGLNQISELAISETDLFTVQQFVKDKVDGFEPTAAHILATSFRWACIATTNYDRLVELAYERAESPAQTPVPFIENGDRVEDRMQASNAVMLLKLHGCVTRIGNTNCPLILTTEQYIDHKKGRDRTFDHLRNKAYERSIIFVGYGLQDPDIREILMVLTELGDARPRSYLVAPKFDAIRRRFWESKKITPIEGTFDDLMKALNTKIAAPLRGFAIPIASAHPIVERFAVHGATLSPNCLQFLNTHVDYVRAVKSTERIDPKSFYKGANPGWAAIEQKLDCRRSLADTILTEYILEAADPAREMEFVLIKAHAGAGTTVLMRRVAWDATHDFNALCLYLRPTGVINAAAIQELITYCKERVYLFVDNATERIRELLALATDIGPEGKNLTVFLSERINEWNVDGAPISHLITDNYELEYLAPKEIDELIALLEEHRALGTLSDATPDERKSAFAARYGRQLLVALHEATLGKRFEDILEDEYKNVSPPEAQRLYLTLCILNRFDVKVRAGAMSRIHGIPFEEFKNRLHKPLENVVLFEFDPSVKDFVFSTRHPLIAQMVFERILVTQEQRFDEYIRCLRGLNIDYSTDRKAFNYLLRARSLMDLFPNQELVAHIYSVGKQIAENDHYLYQQMGIFEMSRPDGNLMTALEFLRKAESIAPRNLYIQHSIAECYVRMADEARTPLEQTKYFNQAATICQALKRKMVNDAHPTHTLVKIGVRRLKALLNAPDSDELPEEFEETIKVTEGMLSDGLLQFPGDSFLLTVESELADVLNDSARGLKSLERAFKNNARSTPLARRLVACYLRKGNADEAKTTLEQALTANSGDRKLHYMYAKMLLQKPDSDHDVLLYHLQRSFAPGGRDFDAQLLLGRQYYIMGQIDESRKVFDKLRDAPVSFENRMAVLYTLPGRYYGNVERIEPSYVFVRRDGHGDRVFCHRHNSPEDDWKRLTIGARVSFLIGFNFRGPVGRDLKVQGSASA